MSDLRWCPWRSCPPCVLAIYTLPRHRYRTLSDLEVVSLAQLSARRPPSAPSAATAEGTHVRCFRRMAACRFSTTGYGLDYYAAMEHVVRWVRVEAMRRTRCNASQAVCNVFVRQSWMVAGGPGPCCQGVQDLHVQSYVALGTCHGGG